MTERHLQPFNPLLKVIDGCQFQPFTRLHKELRVYIWESLLHHERFIHVRLDPDPENGQQRHVGDDGRYTVTVKSHRVMSKLFHICGESRDVAMRFYRLHVSCRYEWNGARGDGMLYLNPELDILHVDPGKGQSRFVDFVDDMSMKDPRRVGLANIAMTGNDINRLDGIDMAQLSATKRTSFTHWISSLRQFLFLSIEGAGRMHKGPRNGIPTIRKFEMHRSRPVLASIPTFERLPQDLRPIARDLRHVFVGTTDPRRMVFHWKKLLEEWGLDADLNSSIQYRFMISCCRGGAQEPSAIVDHQSAVDWLQEENEQWIKWQQKGSRDGGLIETPEQLEKAPQPALGFWLFPIQSLGALPADEVYNDRSSFWRAKRVLNMSQHPPELCLSIL